MCGIVGFTGNHQAAPILLDGLSKLEYRGYDSAGIAVRDGEGETTVIKAKGRLKGLSEKTNGGESVPGTCGIGHTRWATHGEPSENNAHPHMTDDGNIVAVHNGTILSINKTRAEEDVRIRADSWRVCPFFTLTGSRPGIPVFFIYGNIRVV